MANYKDILDAMDAEGKARAQSNPFLRIGSGISSLAEVFQFKKDLETKELEERLKAAQAAQIEANTANAIRPIGDITGENQRIAAKVAENKARFEKLRRQALGMEPLPLPKEGVEFEELMQRPEDVQRTETDAFKKEYGVLPSATVDEYKTLQNTVGGVWSNPQNPSQVSYTPVAGWLHVKPGSALNAAAQTQRQDKAIEAQKDNQIRGELMRMRAEDRAQARQELKEVRPKIQDLNRQLKLVDDIEKGMVYAIQNDINVTGFLSEPLNRLREAVAPFPKEQQEILTSLRLAFADFVRERGGTAFTDTERAVFGPIMPEEKMDERTNLYRIGKMRQIMKDRLDSYVKDVPDAGRFVSQPQGGAAKVPDNGPAPGSNIGQRLTATNPQTKQRIESLDGGKTWRPIK